jgi:hypothetical protein
VFFYILSYAWRKAKGYWYVKPSTEDSIWVDTFPHCFIWCRYLESNNTEKGDRVIQYQWGFRKLSSFIFGEDYSYFKDIYEYPNRKCTKRETKTTEWINNLIVELW